MNRRKCCFHHTLYFCLLFGGAAAPAGDELKYDYVTIRSSSDEPIALAGAAPSNHPGAPAQPLVPSPGDTTYYVDSSGGSDDHKGTSAQSAWKSLAKFDGIEFKPGDKILLKAGCRFIGPLRSNGPGAEGKPIVIGR